MNVILLAIIILSALGLERLVSIKVTKSPKGREFIRSHRLFHPNTLSLLRIPMGVISICFAASGHWSLAVLWFAGWMITDLTDGTIARNCDLSTETGKWLDPLSDKCMTFPGLLYFSLGKDIPIPLPFPSVLIFLIIDTVGQMSRLFTKKSAANSFGKAKTALVTILLLVMSFNQFITLPNPKSSAIFIQIMMASCIILAFLSFYCKVVPDNWYANSLTLCNFLCGLAAIYLVWFKGWHARAFGLVFLGQFFDLFDGRMARKFGSTPLGAFFDDVADATSFGLAIGCVIFHGLAFRAPFINPWVAGFVAVFYICCLIYRLYRFLKPTRQLPKGIFQGLPSPAGALAAGSLIIATFHFEHVLLSYCAAAGVILISLLMISNIPYKHFGQTLWPTMPRGLKLLLFIVLIIYANFAIVYRNYWVKTLIWTCLALALAYIFGAIGCGKQEHDETSQKP